MSTPAAYVVVYDISDGRERRRVDRVLKGFGFRRQKSVFECRLDVRARRELMERLENLGLQTGFVKMYRLERTCPNPVFGRDGEDPDAGAAYVV